MEGGGGEGRVLTFAFLIVKVEGDAGFLQADRVVDILEDVSGVDSSVTVSGKLCLKFVGRDEEEM